MDDVGAFAGMYRNWWHVVREAADDVLQSEPDARDAAQQVFMRVWESGDWRRIDDPERFFSRAGRNEALAVLRRRRRRRSILGAEARPHWLPGRSPSPEEVLLRSERRDRLLQLIGRLPPRCRLVCALTFVEGLTHRESAEKLGISVQAVGRTPRLGRE
jgi:RNA polymerase sigma-70 factor (ECF subfamily)